MRAESEMAIMHSLDSSTVTGDAVYRKIVWRILPLLMISYILNYLDRSNIGFAKLAFAKDLHMNEAVFGLGAGLFYLGYSAFEIPSNLMLNKVGARLTMLRIMMGWGLCATAFAFMMSPSHYYILRFLLGVAEAGFFPGVLLYISFWIPASRRAGFTAMFMSAMAISGIIGGPISGAVMHGLDGVAGMKGWQWMFIVEGLPSVLMGFVVYRALSDKPADAPWLSDAEKLVLAAEFEAEKTERTESGANHRNFGAALKDIRFWSMAGMSVPLVAGAAGLQLWLPTVIKQSGVTNVLHVGLLAALPFIVAVIVQQLVARRSDRAKERRWHAAIPTLVGASGWALLTQVDHSLVPAMVALTMIAAGYMGATGPFWAMPSRYLTGTAAAGGLALIAMLGGLGSFLSPTIVGWLATGKNGLTYGYLYYAALLTVGPLVMLYGTHRIEATRQH
jgi:sugar phosphate permease